MEVIKTGKPFFTYDIPVFPRFGDRFINLKAF